MLNNNFKALLNMSNDVSFKNVNNETVTKTQIYPQSKFDTNGHYNYIASVFNYNATTVANSFTNEQTKYTYQGITGQTDGNGFILFVGTGNTAATVEDYKLDTPADLTVSDSACYHYENNKTVVKRTFVNSTGSDITIKEVGMYLFRGGSNSSDKRYPVMLGRRVLANPITIGIGDSKTFEYEIDFGTVSFNEG